MQSDAGTGGAYANDGPRQLIVLLHGAPAFGAVERYVVSLGEALGARGEEVALVHPAVPELEPFGAIQGVRAEPFPYPPSSTASLVLDLVRTLRRLRPSVVHVTDVWAPALVASRLAGVRHVVLTHHTPELPRRDNRAGRLWWHLGWLMRPDVIYTSESDRRTDGRRLLRRHVIPLGIDLKRFVRPPRVPNSTAPTIGNVGRLAAQKGQRTLVESAPHVLARYPDARFVIVGEGELDAELRRDAQRLGVGEQFTFTGARADVPELLATFDVFAFPSHFEGLCLAVIEAQAAGVPVVASPVGGIRETVIAGETGVLVDPGRPGELAEAIIGLLDHPDRAHRLAMEAQRRVVARHAVGLMVDRTIALYG